jgi:hypothetical protein
LVLLKLLQYLRCNKKYSETSLGVQQAVLVSGLGKQLRHQQMVANLLQLKMGVLYTYLQMAGSLGLPLIRGAIGNQSPRPPTVPSSWLWLMLVRFTPLQIREPHGRFAMPRAIGSRWLPQLTVSAWWQLPTEGKSTRRLIQA